MTVTVTASQPSSMATTVMLMAGNGQHGRRESDFTAADITIPANDTKGVGILTINDDYDVGGQRGPSPWSPWSETRCPAR